MEQMKINQQITSFYKTTYDNSIDAMNTLHNQTEKMINFSLQHAPWIPEQSKNFVSIWAKAYRKGFEDFKAATDLQYKKLETMFMPKERSI
jgi:hypothetical protein